MSSAMQSRFSFDDLEVLSSNRPYAIRFPENEFLDQDEEWCEVKIGGSWQKIRLHDYPEIYKIPGLYESIFYKVLRCTSPSTVGHVFKDVFLDQGLNPSAFNILDLGAGNGMMGEVLQYMGIKRIAGLDILEDARVAATRDRPWVYDEYFVCDLLNLSVANEAKLKNRKFNVLCSIAALGFGDIPKGVFSRALSLIEPGGWVVFNIKEDFLRTNSRPNSDDFADLIHEMLDSQALQLERYKRYCHRYSITGKPLYYAAVVCRKLG